MVAIASIVGGVIDVASVGTLMAVDTAGVAQHSPRSRKPSANQPRVGRISARRNRLPASRGPRGIEFDLKRMQFYAV